MAHPDVPSEQVFVDLAYTRLAAMRDATRSMLQEAFADKSSGFQAVTERDMRVRSGLSRLEQLFIGSESLVFGRIDRARSAVGPTGAPGPSRAAARSEPGVDSFHIGRLGISGVDQEPLVVDWRAPVAEPFYRATGADPMGLALRRHLLCNGPKVVDLEDELFDVDGDVRGRSLGFGGRQVLMATLDRSRSGRMRDIVATVQGEQDEIIRAPLPGVIVVQGGPGTGKTAVALHRAAYLLYTHRFPLEKQGVLVVGPNRTFLRYIEHVLPSLDETGVEMSTVNGLYPSSIKSPVTVDEDRPTARLKGDARMAKVIARALSIRQRPLRQAVRVPYGGRMLRLSVEASQQIVAAAKRRPGTHNARRRLVEAYLWRYLATQMSEEGQVGGTPPPDPGDLGRNLRHVPGIAEALERMWPLLSPEQLLRDLFGAKPLIDLSAQGVLSEQEKDLLARERGESLETSGWSAADVALLDEALALLGPRHKSAVDSNVGTRAYGHVVVDEAQDLSPMQLRMIARRSLSSSMTLVGDIAQATGPTVPGSWADVVTHLSTRRGWKLLELSVNYRTPSEIMELASEVLAQVDGSLRPPESVRSSGRPPRLLRAAPSPGASRLLGLLVDVVGEEISALAERVALGDPSSQATPLGESGGQPLTPSYGAANGTLAVIAAPSALEGAAGALSDAHFDFGMAGREALDRPITVLSVDDAKGLEFDAVIVLEPRSVVAESPQGLRGLYVAFTRATQSLSVLHQEDLPFGVGGVSGSVAEPSGRGASQQGLA